MTIPLILRRNRGILLGRTDEVSLVIVAPTGPPPLDVTYRGFRVIYPEGSTAGRPRSLDSRDNGAGAAGEIRYDFGGIFSSDLSNPLNLRVTVPVTFTEAALGATIEVPTAATRESTKAMMPSVAAAAGGGPATGTPYGESDGRSGLP